MIDFDARRYPFTGFGDEPNASIKFMLIRYINRDAEHGWADGDARVTGFEIRHSNDIVEQFDGLSPMTFTSRLWFRDREALEALLAVRGRQATLRYAWGITTSAGGTKEIIADAPYLALPNTRLMRVADIKTPRGQHPEATATFRRAVGATSVAGYAVATETGD